MADMLDSSSVHRWPPILVCMATRGDGRPPSSTAEWLAQNPPAPERFTRTLASVAGATAAGEDFMFAVREFLDEFSVRYSPELRAAAIVERPPQTGDSRFDAFIGALAEHLALRFELERPPWSVEQDRFLERFWFVSEVPGFRAIAIAQAPAAFKRRGVFIPERSLQRV
jgi:hypothetical protein